VAQLAVHVLEVEEASGHEEVGADVAVGPLHLPLGLRPVGLAGTRHEAVVRCAGEQLGVVDDGLVFIRKPSINHALAHSHGPGVRSAVYTAPSSMFQGSSAS
jgi:hypothetical protein